MLIVADGFDGYQFSDLTGRGLRKNGSQTTAFNTTTKKTGNASYYLNSHHENICKDISYTTCRTFAAGCHIYVNTTGTIATPDGIMEAWCPTTCQVSLGITVTSSLVTLRAWRGCYSDPYAELGSASGTFPVNEWHYVEYKVFIDDTAGTFEAWVDGTRVINLTGQDTKKATSENYATTFVISGSNHRYPSFDYWPIIPKYFDNWYLVDCTNSPAPTDRLGPIEIEPLYPTGEGDLTDFSAQGAATPHECCDEIPMDSATTYMKASAVGSQHTFTVDPYNPASRRRIIGVAPLVWLAKNHENYKEVKHLIRQNGVDATGDTIALPRYVKDTWEGKYDPIFLTNPETEDDWQQEDLADVQAGIEITGGPF